MAERRYSDEETAAIFKAASEQQQAPFAAPAGALTTPDVSDGMTLAQLQEIGREVGIPGELVERAARDLDRRPRASVRRFIGLPIGVGRTVALQRTLTEPEWERLVVDLRETFDARGRLHSDGNFRQWTNGNLQALLEPTPGGQQLRLKTVKGDAYRMISGGLLMLAVDAALVAVRTISGHGVSAGFIPLVGVIGISWVALGALRIPGWAKRRQKQMDEIAARLTESNAAAERE